MFRLRKKKKILEGCPGRDLNPHGPYGPQDFKSCVSTNSTTRAGDVQNTKKYLLNKKAFPEEGSVCLCPIYPDYDLR